ncbi:LIC_10190 family membrane protein [Flavobacterium ginsenosidimutans]|uniref:LIC_10190 family membrane protein n=1 Tax=Flavobacterium ginsenosidimutans TaxID=687844 RepID=UPI003D98074D
MILIAISWIYILFTTINLGVGLDKTMKLNNKNFAITSILGLFSTTMVASIWAIFGRINIEFHIVLILLNVFLLLKFHNSVIDLYKSFLLELQQLQKSLQIILAVVTVLILLQCASIPFVIDNESYYIQTIKWLNEYGFIKGLANLHLFYGQTSGWHITQSVFNFSFLYKNFNDLSGFCLLLGNVFAIQKLNEYNKNGNKNYLLVGLLPLFNIFFFQFISAPSPDIPVYIFSFIFFFYFLENFKQITSETFYLLLILVLFLLYIKNTTLTFAVFPLILLAFNFKSLSEKLLKPILLSASVIILFFIKNLIICGSPLFPSKIFPTLTTDYAIPSAIQTFYYDNLKYYGYFITAEQYNSMSVWDLFIRWITLPKLNGLFNKLSVFFILVLPFFIYKFKNEKALWLLYVNMILQIFLLLITSPQYRFFIQFVLFFSLFCFICLIQNKKLMNVLLVLSQIPIAIILFFPFNLSKFANHKSLMEISTFSTNNIVFPYQNSKSNTTFENIQLGNLKYNSPQKNDFLWASGNGDLPCVNKKQIDTFEKYFQYIPQMRTNELKDGFYAKKISINE